VDYKSLFAKLERNLDQIERSTDLGSTLARILRLLVEDYRDDLGFLGGRIYTRKGGAFVLRHEYPEAVAPRGFRLPSSYEPLQELLSQGFIFRYLTDPGVDRRIEEQLGGRTFAAICVGEPANHIVAFSLQDGVDRDQIVSTLNTIRHVINLKLRKEQLEDRVAQAREIQLSLLPPRAPMLADFDIWGMSQPAEEVGGDLYDFIEVSERSLGIAIADSSGHGLPAALQARDVIIGLRMGVEERLRITATIEKLNRVISRSALASKFISLFYAELETNGTLVYCNAGHVRPLLWFPGKFQELERGGMVLGPNPRAIYERGYARLEPGSVLLAFTDGIVEAQDGAGTMFETERLREIVASQTWTSARRLVETVFDAVRRHSGVDVPIDDQTVLAVVRPVATK
jgi:sigma-B regulation protein RsbU (phosphoserine phosphatase)